MSYASSVKKIWLFIWSILFQGIFCLGGKTCEKRKQMSKENQFMLWMFSEAQPTKVWYYVMGNVFSAVLPSVGSNSRSSLEAQTEMTPQRQTSLSPRGFFPFPS